MSNPAFIVDGFTEKLIIQKVCPNQPIRRTDLNGKDATIPAISKRISSLIRVLGERFFPIIIIVDKEERDIDFKEMAVAIRQELEEEGFNDHEIVIGVADRMIENWIIADWQSFSDTNLSITKTDGINGASIIKKRLGSYDKTTDGVAFFLKCNQSRMYHKSESFRYFVNQLSKIECRYLSKILPE